VVRCSAERVACIKRSREGWAEIMRLKPSVQQKGKQKEGETHTCIYTQKNIKRRFETEPNVKKK
jgi:hypothetical protein